MILFPFNAFAFAFAFAFDNVEVYLGPFGIIDLLRRFDSKLLISLYSFSGIESNRIILLLLLDL